MYAVSAAAGVKRLARTYTTVHDYQEIKAQRLGTTILSFSRSLFLSSKAHVIFFQISSFSCRLYIGVELMWHVTLIFDSKICKSVLIKLLALFKCH